MPLTPLPSPVDERSATATPRERRGFSVLLAPCRARVLLLRVAGAVSACSGISRSTCGSRSPSTGELRLADEGAEGKSRCSFPRGFALTSSRVIPGNQESERRERGTGNRPPVIPSGGPQAGRRGMTTWLSPFPPITPVPGFPPPSRAASDDTYSDSPVRRPQHRAQVQTGLAFQALVRRDQSDAPTWGFGADNLPELRIKVTQTVVVADTDTVRWVRDDQAAIPRRLDGRDGSNSELYRSSDARSHGVRPCRLDRPRIAVGTVYHDWRRRQRRRLRVLPDLPPRSDVEVGPVLEREVTPETGRHATCHQRRFYRNRARPAHGIEQRRIAAPTRRQQRGSGQRLTNRRFAHGLAIPTEMQQCARAVDAHRTSIVKQPHQHELMRHARSAAGVSYRTEITGRARVLGIGLGAIRRIDVVDSL